MVYHKLVVITGASSGIGAATAQAFSAAGHPLLLLARRAQPMDELNLPNAMARAVDVNDSAAVRAAIDEAEKQFGPVDLLVNNAGLMPLNPIADQSEDDIRSLFDINVVALILTAKIVLPAMKERGTGTVVNLGSIAGKQLYENHTVYNGTKYAVHAITEGIRREYADSNVRIILVAPGMVGTNLLNRTEGEVLADYESYKKTIGGGLQPSVIAQAILYAYQLPQEICMRELVVAPTSQAA